MTTTKRFEEAEVEAAIERERHEPRYEVGQVAVEQTVLPIIERTDIAQLSRSISG